VLDYILGIAFLASFLAMLTLWVIIFLVDLKKFVTWMIKGDAYGSAKRTSRR
jgi:type IV secretory pathway component VirB8